MSHRLLVEELTDGRVQVRWRRSGQEDDEPAGAPMPFVSPFGKDEREDLRWYLEDYLIAPFAVYEQRGQAVQAKLAGWGQALFEQVFGSGKPGRDAYQRARDGECTLVVRSHSATFLSLPWELLQDPERATPLALEMQAIDRTLSAARATASVSPGAALRVLMVIARPSGPADVGYQMIARPLIERLAAVRGEVVLEVLRPPTLEALTSRLQAAMAAEVPFHILHFDGHGTFGQVAEASGRDPLRFDATGKARGYLVFEKEGGGNDLVPADEFAMTVNQARVPLVVMNACQSGMVGEAAAEAAVATRLLEGGAASVVAMGYSVYAVAAAEFMAAFYESLFAGKSVSEAVTEGRRRLFRRRERPSPKGLLPLEDWIVPVHYRRAAISFAGLQQTPVPAGLSFDAILDRMHQNGATVGTETSPDLLAAVGRFVGRDAAFYTLELVLKWQRVVVVHGVAGTGKTELAKAFGRWWQATGGVERPDCVLFHSFEPGFASFNLDGVVTEIGLALFGTDFVGRTKDAAQREQMILQVLSEHRLLLIWDNFESVRELPDPSGATLPLDVAQQQRMRAFLQAVAREGSHSAVILTSRTPEDWLGGLRRVELGGLTPGEAAEMAEDVLRPYPAAQPRRQERAFAELMEWLDGHPLSLRLILPQLEKVSATSLLAALKGETTALPAGFVDEGRTESLGASLKYSFDHVAADMREPMLALALFEGVVDENVLSLFSKTDGVPARFGEITEEAWSALLQRLAGIGVVTKLGDGMHGLHPTLPAYLTAEWRHLAGQNFVAEHGAAERALLTAYAEFGKWLDSQLGGGAAETALKLLDRQRRTMGRLLGVALAEKRYGEAANIAGPLGYFCNVRGLRQEGRAWIDRVREAVEDKEGNLPDPESDANKVLMSIVGAQTELRNIQSENDLTSEEAFYRKVLEVLKDKGEPAAIAEAYLKIGTIAEQRGDLDEAQECYSEALEFYKRGNDTTNLAVVCFHLGSIAWRRARQPADLAMAEEWFGRSQEIAERLKHRPGLGRIYHHRGMVAHLRGDLARAEKLYRQALGIREELVDRSGQAETYHQLGMLEQDRGDLAAAKAWLRKALDIAVELKDRSGQAFDYGQLGLLAEAGGDIAAALDWTVRCISLFPEFPHPATGPGPSHLARLTASLGLAALETSWQRCTGATLPKNIRTAIIDMIKKLKS